jgi:hypothetical protein
VYIGDGVGRGQGAGQRRRSAKQYGTLRLR